MSKPIKPRLVDTACAEMWTGRPRDVLYRWAREGRIHRHGTRGHWGARWDLDELPRYAHLCGPGCLTEAACPPLPEPPPVRLPRPRQALDDCT